MSLSLHLIHASCRLLSLRSLTGQAACLPCVRGTSQNNVGSESCKDCAKGRASKNSAYDASKCDVCSQGRYQTSPGQTTCLSCVPGNHQDEIGQTKCKECPMNYFTNIAGQALCKRCNQGLYTTEMGSASCQECGAGKYGDDDGCHECPRGWYRTDVKGIDLTKCLQCDKGETSEDGAKSCQSCSIGQYGATPGNCADCPTGQYQSDKKQTTCLTCQNGRIPNDGKTSCEKPSHLTANDCDLTTQYLNDSSTNPKFHKCAKCPLGASCEGFVGWGGVRAKYGWWRVVAAEDRTTPPACLTKSEDLSPPCAFVQCVYPHACWGLKNPGKYKNASLHDPAEVDRNETCNWEEGYKNNTCGMNNNERCRLCGTCRVGFKRYGDSTKCKKCPDATTNKLMLCIGFVVMVFGSGVLIYMTIKDEEAGEKETSDAVKKIILNFRK